MNKVGGIALLLTALQACSAFVAQPTFSSRTSSALSVSQAQQTGPSLIVVSPPGGIGEVSAVKSAEQGSSVRWFVVSQNKEARQVVLAQEALDAIALAGGSIELAGADAASLLLSSDDPSSAIPAVSTWCGTADAIICTLDGCEPAQQSKKKQKIEGEDPIVEWKNAVKVAAKEASKGVLGIKLTLCSAFEDDDDTDESREGGGGLGSLVEKVFGGSKAEVPSTLAQALSPDTSSVTKLRHGQLFGIPESSPDFSPLVGGPRRDPELCEEYVTRTVRVDPTISVSGNIMMGRNTRSSRHAVGEAAALMALSKVPFQAGADVCVSCQRGTAPPSLSAWTAEFMRVEKMLSTAEGAQLFAAEFTTVPSVERLADWLATKWAPAVLRTYDIATIRSGARPVYARREQGQTRVEIVWQELVNFETTVTGRMFIQVTSDGIVAVRGPGDAAKGYGSISKKPLPGEGVLVRQLAEAASQAVGKGLATRKVVPDAPVEKEEPAPKPEPAVVSSIQAAGTVVAEKPDSESSGPRQAGARRSQERARGRKRKESS